MAIQMFLHTNRYQTEHTNKMKNPTQSDTIFFPGSTTFSFGFWA